MNTKILVQNLKDDMGQELKVLATSSKTDPINKTRSFNGHAKNAKKNNNANVFPTPKIYDPWPCFVK